VPITSAFFSKKPIARCFAVIGLIALTYPAVENWSIGFDRIAQMRVKAVVAIENTVDRAKADRAAAESEYTETQGRSSAKRTELRTGIATRDQNIASMDPNLRLPELRTIATWIKSARPVALCANNASCRDRQ